MKLFVTFWIRETHVYLKQSVAYGAVAALAALVIAKMIAMLRVRSIVVIYKTQT